MWSPGEAIGFAWDRIKSDPFIIVGAIAVATMIAAMPSTLTDVAGEVYWAAVHGTAGSDNPFEQLSDPVYLAITLVGIAVNSLAQAFMMGGIMSFSLKVARHERYSFTDIFSGARWFLPALGINVLGYLGIVLGLILFIIPGVFLALAWSLALPIAVDRDIGAIEALGESYRLTTGHRLSLLVLFLGLGAIALLGLCFCGVGVFVAVAIGQVALAWVYGRLSGTA